MIKVMIVDDEIIFRDYLRGLLPWEDYGMGIVAEARNGVDALEQAKLCKPDIMLVDISMPFMDGLQLTEQLKQSVPDTVVVLVTGHNEFEYARKAIKLGVQDYILKPFTKEELLLTLIHINSHIQKANENKLTLKVNETMLNEWTLNRLIMNELPDSEESRERLAALHLHATSTYTYQVACIEIDHMEVNWSNSSDRELWKFAVTNILNETLQVDGKLIVFNGPEGRIICIYALEAMQSAAFIEGFEHLKELIKKYLKLTITIGVGSVYPAHDGLRRSYSEAIDALHNKFVIGNDSVIVHGERRANTGQWSSGIVNSQRREELQLALKLMDRQAIESQLQDIFEAMKGQSLSIDYVYVICMGLVSTCLSHLTENGHPVEDCFGEHFYPYSMITKKQSIDETANWIMEVHLRVIDYMKLHRLTKSDKIADLAQQYIHEHYGDPELKVEQIAQHVFINGSYLRAIFKKAHGVTVTDYVTKTRMQTAKDLLLSGDMKISDVSTRVGYNDPAYFSRAFKKYYGFAPSELDYTPNT
ncbi:response regulator [Paenibacillus agaridevorans]|uniref:response regulator n=1 Tax=Paenibacillus agaridevorans TaxID=171404 RepID=UPI001BE41DB7|nr:response regulator [Paenibacillus agaridevorans]